MKKISYTIIFFSFLFLGFTLVSSTSVNAQRRYSEREEHSNHNHSRQRSNNHKSYKNKHNNHSSHRSRSNRKSDHYSNGNSRYNKHSSHKNYRSHYSSRRSNNSYRHNRHQHASVGHYYSNRTRCYDHSNYGRVVVDFGCEPVVIRSRDCDYYYNEGNYYQYRNEIGYIRVSDPYETRFYSLPDNCNSYDHRGRSYYVSGDIFFRRFGDHYRIVKRPLGINISLNF